MKNLLFLLVFISFSLSGMTQRNFVGVYFSDLYKFPGMGVFFDDAVWLSGDDQLSANRNYNRFGFGLQWQRELKSRDWLLSFKGGMGMRRLHEFFTYSKPDPQSPAIVYNRDFDATYRQNSFFFLPGIYYKIGSDSRISGHGGMELLFNYYGKGTQNSRVIDDNVSTSTFDPGDTTSTSFLEVRTDHGENHANFTFSPGFALGAGLVAGLKVRITKKLYFGIDIAEYFSYLHFSGTTITDYNSESNQTVVQNGTEISSQHSTYKLHQEFTKVYQQFSFSSLVANMSISYRF